MANGSIRVQLGALTSEESARGEWDRLARRHADLLGAFRPQVVRFEREGQATLFRLRTGGFADVASAQAFCEQARARSVPCTVIR
ncbi:SPOR domain-containing protein [Roseomonas soli]|uniref:SPOR domain-containing protein n=1 Tax=Neoroseomonas soli TaxID=1081025 RepID=A0A9X9X540_9PROT|nr:SPOR domain-containing protein [Neoroseomonas soli]